MARLLRLAQAGAWDQVTARGKEQRSIYRDERARRHFPRVAGGNAFARGSARMFWIVERLHMGFRLWLAKTLHTWKRLGFLHISVTLNS